MTPDLQSEFYALSERAKRLLKSVPEVECYHQAFSFWKTPSWSPPYRCTVYAPVPTKDRKLPFAEYNFWKRDIDSEKFRSPVERLRHPKVLDPTFDRDVLGLDQGEIEQIEQRISSIPIPLYLGLPDWAGADGTRFEFHYDGRMHGVTIHWWENHPEEWRPFTEIIIQIMDEFEKRRETKLESGSVIK